jgi:RNA polymerase sigma factor (sigma-70 family)
MSGVLAKRKLVASEPHCYIGTATISSYTVTAANTMNAGLLDELVRTAMASTEQSPEALHGLTIFVKRKAREIAETWRLRPNYEWIDVSRFVEDVGKARDRWLSVLKNTSDKAAALDSWLNSFARKYLFEQLADRAREGGPADRTRLAEELVNWLQAAVCAKTKGPSFSEHDQKDIAQTVCLKVFKKLPTYRTGSFYGWLNAILQNVINDSLRYKYGRPEDSLNEPISGVDQDSDGALERISTIADDNSARIPDQVDNRELLAKVEAFLDGYPNQRDVRIFKLKKIDGLSSREIAKRLKISVQTVDMAVFHVRMKLRELPEARAWLDEDDE